MPEILISVTNKIPQLVGDVRQITSGNRDYRLRLIFDDDWEDGEKTVLFVRENGFVYPPVRTENDECVIPEVNGVPIREWLYVGVKQGEVHTSRPCGVTVYRSIADMIDDEAVQPDPSMWEDVLERLEELEANGGGSVPAGTDLVGHAMISLMGANYDSLEVTSITYPSDVTDEADQQRMLRSGAVKAAVAVSESEDEFEAGVLDCIDTDGIRFTFAGITVGKNRTAFVTVQSIEDSNEYEATVLAVHEGGGSSGGDAMRLKVLAELPYEGSTPIIDMIDFTREYTFADIVEAFVAGRTITLHTECDVVPYQYGMFWLERFTNSGGVGGFEFHGHYWRVKDVEADVDEGWVPAVAFLREDGTLTVEDREWSGYAKQAEVDKLSEAIDDLQNKTPQEYYLLKSPNGTIFKVIVTDAGTLEVIGEADIILPDLIPGRLLLWNDEFDGESLNTDIWNFELGYIRNNEKQYYTNETKNVYVSDSVLHLVALKDNPTNDFEWSSASIDSQTLRDTGFSYGYGLIEIKARCLTPSSGVWPAFWSRGASQQSEGWPMCGEIDIGELFFNGADSTHHYNPGIFWYDWHYLLQKSQRATDDGLITGSAIYKTVDTDWHFYGMERSETAMIFYFDREEFCRIDLTALDNTDIQSAMGQPMSVKLNVAMGSTGGTIPENLERAEFDIEYVRYYAPVNVTESTDSGTWDFPDYMPTELAPSKIARIIPERDMTNGKNQYLYWESSDSTKIDATAGLIRTKSGVSGDVTVTMKDTFGNSKSAIITIKDDANCISDEVREIPTNPTIMPYGETSNIQVRLVPYWVTNHTVTAVLDPAIDGVEVSVAESSHVIAKYSTPCSIISVTNNGTHTENVTANLIITAKDSGKTLTLPLTIKANAKEFDTTGMYAAYLHENTVETSSGVGTINDATGNNNDPLTNLYYTTSYNNGVCRVPGKGIQSQVQNGQFNPNTAEGFFLEEFDPNASRTFVFNIKSGMIETRSQYVANQALLSVVHSGVGRYNVSNTTDGRHGISFSYAYSSNNEGGYIGIISVVPNAAVNGYTSLTTYLNPDNSVQPEVDTTEYLHSANFVHTVFCIYDADAKQLSAYSIVDGKVLAALYTGMSRASTEAYYNAGNFGIVLDTTVSETVLAESETDPFYWRYGDGNKVCSDFVRAICVYDKVLNKDEMIDIANRLTAHYA